MTKRALLVIDVQKDFCEGGALAVAGGNSTVPIINSLMESKFFDLIIGSQDYHPSNHGSFASTNEVDPFTMGVLNGNLQVMWPDHCVIDTDGVKFHPELNVWNMNMIIQKGEDPTIDSYSAFKDNDGLNPSGLASVLRDTDIEEVYVVGLALDYCVKFTALDAIEEGFHTVVVTDATAAVDQDAVTKTFDELLGAGCSITDSTFLLNLTYRV